MPFQPEVNQPLTIDGVTYVIAEHPAARGIPYGQEGRQAVVYQLVAGSDKRAIKVFKQRYQVPSLVSLAKRLEPHATMPGLQVCRRVVLSPQQHENLLSLYPDLIYSVVMPWVEGPTWLEVMVERAELPPEQSITLARSLTSILSGMEQEGLAHCDLSGPNVLLPVMAKGPATFQSATALVDVEGMFGPDLRRPEVIASGSAGYAHKTAPDGIWAANADRFAGAVIISEMLAWSDPQIRQAAWGESYFDPQEVQTDGERYRQLVSSLTRNWGENVARMFERAWRSQTLNDCPTFGQWMVILPKSAPAPQASPTAAPAAIVAAVDTDQSAESKVRTLMEMASLFERQNNLPSALDTYRQAQSLLPPNSALGQELSYIVADLQQKVGPQQAPAATPFAPAQPSAPAYPPPPSPTPPSTPQYTPQPQPTPPTAPPPAPAPSEVDNLFDQGMLAFRRGDWAQARGYLWEVVRRQPGYKRGDQDAAWLLSTAEAQLAPQPQPQPPQPSPAQPPQPAPTYQPTEVAQPQQAARAAAKAAREARKRRAQLVASATLGLLLLVFGVISVLILQGMVRGGQAQVPPVAAEPTPSPLPQAIGTPQIQDRTKTFIGLIRFTDGISALDEADLFSQQFPQPEEGTQYQVWLVSEDGARLSLGALNVDENGKGNLQYKDADGRNLVALYNRCEVTAEPDPDPAPNTPDGNVVFQAALPTEALASVKEVLVSDQDVPQGRGWSAALRAEAEQLNAIAHEMLSAQNRGDLERMRHDAEGIANIIVGSEAETFGDLNGDGNPARFSVVDSYGLLENGQRAGLIKGLINETNQAISSSDVTKNIEVHGGHTVTSAENVKQWADELLPLAEKIARSTSTDEVKSEVRQAVDLAKNIFSGDDANGDEKVAPIPGEGGALTAYTHAQYMADLIFEIEDLSQQPALNDAASPSHDEHK